MTFKKRCGWCCAPLKEEEMDQEYCNKCLVEKAETEAVEDAVSEQDYREQNPLERPSE